MVPEKFIFVLTPIKTANANNLAKIFYNDHMKIYTLLLVIFLTGCAAPPTSQTAAKYGFNKNFIKTNTFTLASYQKILQPGKSVNIYVEGDGNAWASRYKVSDDPSPRTGTTMLLAALDHNPNVVYLARPCQYSPQDLKTICDSKYWSIARYSETVVESISVAIDSIKQQCQAPQINLIGYSGGGALVVLVSARRNDIASIRTVAGNLDLTTMDEIHDTTPLSESLDPISVAQKVKNIPQLHFVGSKDHIVPVEIATNFVKAAGLNLNKVIVLKGANHNNIWHEHWERLLQYAMSTASND